MLRLLRGLDECLKAVKNPFEAEAERVVTVGVGGGLGHRLSKGGELVRMIGEHIGDRDDDVLLGPASGARVRTTQGGWCSTANGRAPESALHLADETR